MPFGLVNTVAVFCRMVRLLLKDIPNVESYVDDIVIHSADWASHMEVLKMVLQRIRDAGLSVRPTKCKSGHAVVDLLGQTVGQGKLRQQDRR